MWAACERQPEQGVFAFAPAVGGADRGRQEVNFYSAAACLRCDQVDGTGGHAAPSFAGMANRYDRAALLTSLLESDAKVADGFGPTSAMPTMTTLLTPRTARDVTANLLMLK